MGTKYSSTSVSGYNASPPSDAGAATEENRITWSKIKTKLPDPLKTAIEAIDTNLVTAFDVGPVSKSANYTTVADDHLKTISCTAAITISLMDASTATAGYTVNISNQSSGNVTIGRATPGDTINGTAADMTLTTMTAATLRVNLAATGYEVIGVSVKELAELGRADGNFIVADGTKFVVESGATARTSLGLGTAATQNTGTSGATVPLLDAANTASADQTLEASGAISVGRFFNLYLNNTTPAAGNTIGIVNFQGEDSASAKVNYCDWRGRIVSPTAGSHSGEFVVLTYQAGTNAERLIIRNGVYTPGATGGDKGLNTINASAVYDDNVLLTCYVIEALEEGAVNLAAWDARTPDRKSEDGKVAEVRTHEPAARFAARAAMMLDPASYAAEWKTKRHLPSMPSPAEWEAAGQKMSTGDLIQRLWETVEVQAVHIDKLRQRIEALGG